ncbi:MAG: ribonuclease H-like domain-containing protein [Firmicutes bacterium]|nr:ribonuclease H-like domain-containing protein [Bacillota bacterium]
MEVITREIKTEYFSNAILDEYFEGRSFCTYDIETLGLDPRRAPVILAGMMCVSPDGTAQVKQFFLEEPEEEHILLDRIVEELNKYDYIVTFNGHRFDIPYVEKRYKMIYHCLPDVRPYELDLYLVIKGHSGLKETLPSLRQKCIEEYMGLASERDDEISGGESVQLYYEYLLEEDPALKESIKKTILLHNYDDVVQLYRLLPILRQCDLHGASFKLGFPVYEKQDAAGMVLNVSNIKLNKTGLKITGKYTGDLFTYKSFSDMDQIWEAEFNRDRSFSVTCPVSARSNALFVNLLDFFAETDDFRDYRGFVNNYLILKDENELYYRDINHFVRRLLEKLL